jgi:hypothetical protein
MPPKCLSGAPALRKSPPIRWNSPTAVSGSITITVSFAGGRSPKPPGALTLYFRSFETEEGKDVLKIYDFSSSELLATLSGHYNPDTLPQPVTAESGIAFLIFTSNSSVTDKGWEIYYPKSTQGTEELHNTNNLKVFPNPASEEITVTFNAEKKGNAEIGIMTVEGKIIRNSNILVTPGINSIVVGLSDLLPGIYLLKFQDDSGIFIQKFVVI